MFIKVENLNFFYGKTQALFDINLEIEKGDVVVLLGASGAGKSTLMRTFNLIEKPSTGTLFIADQSFDLSQNINQKELAYLRQKVGMVFQQYHLWPHLTVLENLIYAPMKVLEIDRETALKNAEFELERLQLNEFKNRYPLALSGGQQQRVAIARALMMNPEVLLFDEPTAALDPQITNQVVQIIKDLQSSQITQVIVTHEVEFAKKVATKVVYMEQGKIVELGDASIFEKPQSTAFTQYLSHS